MLVFKQSFYYDKPFNIVFLCGNKYEKGNSRDKRTILKEFLQSLETCIFPIILEENFCFKGNSKTYLPYDDIFLKDLASIEQLASLYADKIFVIHDTVSTAAEIGMFAIDSELAKRLCIIVPDDVSVDGNRIGGFINLAFLSKNAINRVEKIVYYPDVDIHVFSSERSDYYTSFHENCIGEELSNSIHDFLAEQQKTKKIHFSKSPYNRNSNSSEIIDYCLSNSKKLITVSVHVNALMVQLLSMLYLPHVREILRAETSISSHVNNLFNEYKSVVKSTIVHLAKEDISDYNVKIELKNSITDIKPAVGYFLYLLQAVDFIKLTQSENGKGSNIRKFQFTGSLDQFKDCFAGYVYDLNGSAYGELKL